MKLDNLKIIKDAINKLKSYDFDYYVPSVWIEPDTAEIKPIKVNPYNFYYASILRIYGLSKRKEPISKNKNFSVATGKNNAIIYNMFIRHTTAYDHDNDGKLIESNDKLKENGTFLKAIALLPYLFSLGINTIYLLPVCQRGLANKKGTIGSPYAIKNPYNIDNTLADNLIEVDAETQFKAFIEAAHLVGMKIVLEFAFRTASLDSELAIARPKWFYWLDAEKADSYSPPKFDDEKLTLMKQKIEDGDFYNLPEPSQDYKDLFVEPPQSVSLKKGQIIGTTKDNKKCVIPSAFSDWPPDDTQPVWRDVTYFKLYNKPEFNYIAYNTIRMYDKKLALQKYENESIWDYLEGIIPYYKSEYKIDGVMVDMGHSLPALLREKIIKDLKKQDKSFIFWEENFTLNPKSAKEGYDAAVGYLCFDEHIPSKIRSFLSRLDSGDVPIQFFSTPENHNTPRAASRVGSMEFSKLTFALNCIMPGLPFIHAGFELGEKIPVNTGLSFSVEEIKNYPENILPLFSESKLCWDEVRPEMLDFFRKFVQIRKQYIKNANNLKKNSIIPLDYGDENTIAFVRRYDDYKVFFAGNMNSNKTVEIPVSFPCCKNFENLFTNESFEIPQDTGILNFNLKPFEVLCGLLNEEV